MSLIRLPLVILAICIFVHDSHGNEEVIRAQEETVECLDSKETKGYSYSKFFERSGTGSMAIASIAISKEQVPFGSNQYYITFESSGTYKIEEIIKDLKRQNFYLLINHRVDDSSSGTYLGVLVVKAAEIIEFASPLWLMRNEKWKNDQNIELGKFLGSYDSTNLKKFFSLQTESSGKYETFVKETFVKKFGEWHALANSNPKVNSWDSRREWKLPDNFVYCMKELSDITNSIGFLIEAKLFKFTPTTKPQSEEPLTWEIIIPNHFKAIYIKTFSAAGSDYNREYYIKVYN